MPELTVPLGQMIRDGAERLRHSGLCEPRRQALRIWGDLSEDGPARVFLEPEWPVDAGAAGRFQTAIARRALGEPLAHVTGWTGFRRMSLVSDGRALVPRPETEGLVDLLLQRVRTGRVVDVGTGSGCIALSLAQEGAFTEIVGVDCSAGALAMAGLNRQVVGVPVTLVLGDLCRPLRSGAFDALISNPPYLTVGEYASLDASVRDWEPAVALVSGEDGMEATTRLLDEGREVLRPGGWLALEVDCSRAAMAAKRACSFGWSDVSVQTDLLGRERYLLARRSNTR
jgi:release factor glutamine methyltransferase